MGSACVVVLGVPVQDSAQVVFTGDEHAVGAFGPDGANPAFRERICPRAAWRDLDGLHVLGGELAIEGGGELAVAVAVTVSDEEAEAAAGPVLEGSSGGSGPAVSPRPGWGAR